MLIYLLTLIDNEGDRQTFTAIYLHQILLGKQHLKSFFSVQNDSF